jgi:hypothetical protein
MSNSENASLVLKGYDLSSTESNAGVCNTANTSFTWKNVNLRTLLGTMYEKYDKFNIVLNTIACSKTPAALGVSYGNSDVDNLQVLLNIQGLPFINNTYETVKQHNTLTSVIGSFQFPSANATCSTQYFYSSNSATFGKSQELCNITIFYTKVLDGNPPTTNAAFPEPVFIFDIFGIPNDDGFKNGSRMLPPPHPFY